MCRADSSIALDHAQRLPAAFLADGLEIDAGHDAMARPFKAVGKTLGCERETAACAAEHELLGHFLFSEIDEIFVRYNASA